MAKKLIYIADVEVNVCTVIKYFLLKEGYEAVVFNNGRSLYEAFIAKPADMILMDVIIPEMDGYSICSLIRQKSSVPIIFVSAKNTESDKVAGLALGSDDYLSKPFSPMELVARVKSIFRRIEMDKGDICGSEVINISDVCINPYIKQVEFEGKNIGLTNMEFLLLHYLAVNRPRAVSRGELLGKVWGFESIVETRATDDMVKRIRKKIADAGSKLKIETVWGFGFKITE